LISPFHRVYLLGHEGEIAGRVEFDAERDSVAMIIAEVICDACADACYGFELWRGASCVGVGLCEHREIDATMLDDETREEVARLEECLRHSAWPVAKSKRLLQAISTL
jgi:hypothetical protein